MYELGHKVRLPDIFLRSLERKTKAISIEKNLTDKVDYFGGLLRKLAHTAIFFRRKKKFHWKKKMILLIFSLKTYIVGTR